jgi:hypothetical protein
VPYIQKLVTIILMLLLPYTAHALYLAEQKELFSGVININTSYFAAPYATLNLPEVGGEHQFALDIVTDSWDQVIGDIGSIGIEYLDIAKYSSFGAEYIYADSPNFPISGYNFYVNFVYSTNINRYMFVGLNYFALKEAQVAVDRTIYKDTNNEALNFSISLEGTITSSNTPGLMMGYAWQVSKQIDIRVTYTRLLFRLNTRVAKIAVSSNAPQSVPQDLLTVMPAKIALIGLTLSYKFN